jgi:hypothetical protein
VQSNLVFPAATPPRRAICALTALKDFFETLNFDGD